MHVSMQVQAQKDHLAEQNQRCKDLEASTRQLEERCSELKESAAGHELRAKEAAAEVLKGNRIIEKVSVSNTLGCISIYTSHGRTSAHLRKPITVPFPHTKLPLQYIAVGRRSFATRLHGAQTLSQGRTKLLC